MSRYILTAFVCALVTISCVEGQGRMMKPPSRSSIWRVPEFAASNPPINFDDSQLNCGGILQADYPGIICGVCGDPRVDRAPRDNEINGKYYKGIITGRYLMGQVVDVEVEYHSHFGFMQWRLCANSSQETQSCFNRWILYLADGSGTRLPARNNDGLHRTQVRLPYGVRCDHCILQWNYRTGNRWGDCRNGTTAPGCGEQETFRGCSDISIS